MSRTKEVAYVSLRALPALILLFIPIFALQAAAADIDFEEGINLIRPSSRYIEYDYYMPEYLNVEDLVFVSCLESADVPLRPSVLCLDTNNFEDLEATKWSDDSNCYVASFNLEGFDCRRVRLQAEYTLEGENRRLTKEIRVNKLSTVLDKILDTQYSDGGWRTSADTAYGIWALSHFPEIFKHEMEHALSWLELNRNEENKCFPKSPCNMRLTLEILNTLRMSGYDDARRVMRDARNWIEKQQNLFEQDDLFTIELDAFTLNSTVALVARNNEVLDYNFSISNGSTRTYEFKANNNITIYAVSPDNFEARIKNKYGDVIYTYQGNNLSYNLQGACWSANKIGEPCNAQITAFATLLDLHELNLQESRRWMVSDIYFPQSAGAYYGWSNTSLDTSLFLTLMHNMTDYETYEDSLIRFEYLEDEAQYDRYIEELTHWLLFQQNNEGTWGVPNGTIADKAMYTAVAVNALLAMGYNRTFEPIEDAERWMSDHEDEIFPNDTKTLGSAFFTLQNNARPLVISDPGVVSIKGPSAELQLYNPTAFNLIDLTYNLSQNLKDFISVEERTTLSAYSYRKVTVSRKASSTGDRYGYLEIRNLGDPIALIPVVITDYPVINLTAEQTAIVFGRKAEIKLNVQKSGHEFICSMKWESEELSSPASFKITKNTAELEANFAELVSKEDLYKGTLTCNARGQDFNIPISVYITRYSSLPVTLEPDLLLINSTDARPVFTITNNLDTDITPQISISGPKEYFDYPASVTLNPNEKRDVTIISKIPPDENYTASLTLTVTALGKSETISILVDMVEEPAEEMNLAFILVIFIAIFGFLGGMALIIYRNRDAVLAYINRFNVVKTKQEIRENIDRLEKIRHDEKTLAIANMVQLLKFQKKPDEEIKKILMKNFTLAEIRKASEKEGLNIKGLEDEPPETVNK